MSVIHWLWFSELKIGLRDKYALLEEFADPQELYEADAAAFREHEVSDYLARVITQSRSIEHPRQILSRCSRLKTDIIPLTDGRYPDRLRNIDNPPFVLYVSGKLPDIDRLAAVAVVGTRKASSRSLEIAYELSCELAENEIFIVSGMAGGIDQEANRAAIDTAGSTVAVLGCGTDICYPSSSRDIYDRITAGSGCMISEYPPGTSPAAANFPMRNRIMSGLCLGVLVIAAPARSGALITANLASDQGRDVFVVPGGIDQSEYAGSNELIKIGAEAVTGTYDIVKQYRDRYPEFFSKPEPVYKGRMRVFKGQGSGLRSAADAESAYDRNSANPASQSDPLEKHAQALASLSPKARAIALSIARGKTGIDEIVAHTGMAAHEVLTELTFLELSGVVENLPGEHFKIN